MNQNEHKVDEEVETQPPVVDDEVKFFNPWDEEFARDLKRDQTKFDF